VHYDQEKGRREAYHEAIGGGMPGGYAAATGRRCTFVGDGYRAVVSSRPERGPTASSRSAARSWSVPLRSYLGAARRLDACRLSRRPPAGARRRSSRWAGRLHDGARQPALDDFVPGPGGGASRASASSTAAAIRGADRRFHARSRPWLRADARVAVPASARTACPLREHVLAQDVMYVGGGSMVNLLAIWRAHGLDVDPARGVAARIVLAGLSAGAMCWFEGGVTTSTGSPAVSTGSASCRLELRALRRRARAPPGFLEAIRTGVDPGRLGRRRRAAARLPRRALWPRSSASRVPHAARPYHVARKRPWAWSEGHDRSRAGCRGHRREAGSRPELAIGELRGLNAAAIAPSAHRAAAGRSRAASRSRAGGPLSI
jgi:hypothetical protein